MKKNLPRWAALLWLAAAPSLLPAQDMAAQYYQAGNTLYGQKNYDQAIRYFDAALDADPRLWQAFQGLGNCYYAKGDKAKALSNYQRCLSLHPDNPSLSAFADSLRSQSDSPHRDSQPAYSQEEKDKILQAAGGSTGEHLELSPSLGIVEGPGSDSGFGFGGGVFYFVDSGLGLGGMAHVYFIDEDFDTATSFELCPAAKINLGGKTLQPYLVGGGGLALVKATTKSINGYVAGNSAGGILPLVELGAGLELKLQWDMDLFLEARIDNVLARLSVSYLPVEAGVVFTQL